MLAGDGLHQAASCRDNYTMLDEMAERKPNTNKQCHVEGICTTSDEFARDNLCNRSLSTCGHASSQQKKDYRGASSFAAEPTGIARFVANSHNRSRAVVTLVVLRFTSAPSIDQLNGTGLRSIAAVQRSTPSDVLSRSPWWHALGLGSLAAVPVPVPRLSDSGGAVSQESFLFIQCDFRPRESLRAAFKLRLVVAESATFSVLSVANCVRASTRTSCSSL